jgi:hypothetical protein
MPDYQHPDSSMTTLDAAQANTLAAVTQQLVNINANLKAVYLQDFDNWSQSVRAGRIPNSNPPLPPKAYVVAKSASGWAYPEQGTDPVCAVPPLPADQSVPTVHPIFTGNDSVMNVPPGDKMSVGYIAVAPDGLRWQKQASPTPFGIAYYYARVA